MVEQKEGHAAEGTAHQQDIEPPPTDASDGTGATGGYQGGEGGVYARAYEIYDHRGWSNSLWLKPNAKFPPPDHDENDAKVKLTGNGAKTPSPDLKAKWARQQPNGNIAQRMPECVVCEQEWFIIGIDTDDYGAKRGGETLAEAEKRWGSLPPTYTSTSRTDGVSKIGFYRIPKGVRLQGGVTFPELDLGDIEIIQPHHRYLVCWPSIHPETGNVYRWFGLHGEMMDGPPPVWEIPELPEPWLQALKEENKTKSKTKASRTGGTAWVECPYIIEQCLTDGEMSAKVAKRLGEATSHCHGGSRHDQILKDSLALLRYGKRGESGVFEAMSALMKTFVNAVTADGSRTKQEAGDEFMRMLSNKGAADRLSEPDEDEPPPYGSIDGAGVLDKVEAWYRRFIRVTFDSDYHLFALFTVHTHLAEECYTTPRLQLDSLVEGAGKSTVLDHLKRLCHNPIQIASLSSPALLPRMLDKGIRTILLDEVHRTLRPDKPGVPDLVAIINTGYRRGATRPVNVPVKGGGWVVEDMPTFAPVAMAGNDPNLEADTRSRMIRVLLMPDLDGSVEDSDWEYLEDDAKALQDEIAQWAGSAREKVKGMRVDLPAGCIGRSKEKWRPLKRIAEAAGGDWPKAADALIERGLAEEAAVREAGLKKQPPGLVALNDLYNVWPDGKTFMPTVELVTLLIGRNANYWGSDNPFGKPLTETRLGMLINQATNRTSVRPGGRGPRGYLLAHLQEAWLRLGISLCEPGNPGEPGEPGADDAGLTDLTDVTGLDETPLGGNGTDPSSNGDKLAGEFPSKRFEELRTRMHDLYGRNMTNDQ